MKQMWARICQSISPKVETSVVFSQTWACLTKETKVPSKCPMCQPRRSRREKEWVKWSSKNFSRHRAKSNSTLTSTVKTWPRGWRVLVEMLVIKRREWRRPKSTSSKISTMDRPQFAPAQRCSKTSMLTILMGQQMSQRIKVSRHKPTQESHRSWKKWDHRARDLSGQQWGTTQDLTRLRGRALAREVDCCHQPQSRIWLVDHKSSCKAIWGTVVGVTISTFKGLRKRYLPKATKRPRNLHKRWCETRSRALVSSRIRIRACKTWVLINQDRPC